MVEAPAVQASPARVAWRWLAPAAAIAVWVWWLAPSAAWFDSGELTAAAVQLGVPHPTGFPAFVLSGHAAARLPLADSALRVHLSAALCGCLAVVLWRRALGRPWPRCAPSAAIETAACLLPAAVPALALHLRATEVYPLTWLAVALALWSWRLEARRRLAVLALLTGLGATIHVEAALLGGGLWVAAAWRCPRAAVRSLPWLVPGLLTLLALPLLARRQPYLSWGDVQSWPALWDHLSGASIRQAYGERIGGSLADVRALWRLVEANLGIHLLGAALVATVSLVRRPAVAAPAAAHAALLPTCTVIAVDALYSVLVNPMGLRDQQAGLLLLLGAVALASIAVEAAAAALPRFAWLAPWVLALWTVAGVTRDDRGSADLRAAGRYADSLLRAAAPAQVLFASADHTAATCQWLQGAMGVRPDVACVPGAFLGDDRMARQQARQTGHSGLAAAVGLAGPLRTAAWIRATAAPLAWQPGLTAADAATAEQLLAGWPWSTVHRSVAPDVAQRAAQELPAAVAALCIACSGDPRCRAAPTLAELASIELGVHATRWAGRQEGLALRLAEAAVAISATAKALHNLAVLLVDRDPRRALALAEAALQHQPDHLRAHRPAARAAVALGLRQVAVQHAQAAVRAMSSAEAPRWLAALADQAPPAWRGELAALASPSGSRP